LTVQFLVSKSAVWSQTVYTKQKLSDVTRKPNDANVFRKSKIKLKCYKLNLQKNFLEILSFDYMV